MPTTYPAILRNGSLEWGEGGPPPLPPGEVAVRITILGVPDRPDRGLTMAAALQAIADGGGPTGIDDPAAWQAEARAERDLPGREG